ncbi:MAG: hypothetical protein EOO40_00505 [Deltaproteobacteria bacterium]|nr:MAG: hypothetical protein EOO40_00505 [Deltaproteobacteria bacterium]
MPHFDANGLSEPLPHEAFTHMVASQARPLDGKPRARTCVNDWLTAQLVTDFDNAETDTKRLFLATACLAHSHAVGLAMTMLADYTGKAEIGDLYIDYLIGKAEIPDKYMETIGDNDSPAPDGD